MALFGSNQPSIRIDKIQNVDVTFAYHPIYDDPHAQYLHEMWSHEQPQRSLYTQKRPSWMANVEFISKIVSLLSGIALIVFVILLWSGASTIASLNIGNLLTVFSFTFFGGLISVGGFKMFSVTANLRKAEERIREVVTNTGGCPYFSVLDDRAKQQYQVHNPHNVGNRDFCRGCRLVDLQGRTVCRLSPFYTN